MTVKQFLLTAIFFISIIPGTFGQVKNGYLYIFPHILVKVDTQRWNVKNDEVFQKSLKEFAELFSIDPSARARLSIQPYNKETNGKKYTRCNFGGFDTYPAYIRLLKERKLVVASDTFYISTHRSHEGDFFHIGTRLFDPLLCNVKISAVGLIRDSTLLKDDVIGCLQTIRMVTPQEIDSMFQLPLNETQHRMLAERQVKEYDDRFRQLFQSYLKNTPESQRQRLINEITEVHNQTYASIGWTVLPSLTELSLDSLIRIRVRYYMQLDGKVKKLEGFYPKGFCYSRYQQSVAKLVNGEFAMDDYSRWLLHETFPSDHAFYSLRLVREHSDIARMQFMIKVKSLLPKYNIENVTTHTNPEKDRVVFRATIRILSDSTTDAYLIYTREADKLRRLIVPPIAVNQKSIFLQQLLPAGPYWISRLNNRSGAYKKVYLVNPAGDSSTWLSYAIPDMLDTTRNVMFQFSHQYEDDPVVNLVRWSKKFPGEHPQDYGQPQNISISDSRTSRASELANQSWNKLLNISGPAQRLYVCTHHAVDINGDGKEEIISFIVSNGKMLFWKCFTYSDKGSLIEMKSETAKRQVRETAKYKALVRRSLLSVDKTSR